MKYPHSDSCTAIDVWSLQRNGDTMRVGWCGARFSRRGETLAAERAVLNTFIFCLFFSFLLIGKWLTWAVKVLRGLNWYLVMVFWVFWCQVGMVWVEKPKTCLLLVMINKNSRCQSTREFGIQHGCNAMYLTKYGARHLNSGVRCSQLNRAGLQPDQ